MQLLRVRVGPPLLLSSYLRAGECGFFRGCQLLEMARNLGDLLPFSAHSSSRSLALARSSQVGGSVG